MRGIVRSAKVYIADTNVLIVNPYALSILSGNRVPVLEEERGLSGQLETSYDQKPNDVILSEIVLKELDNLRHDRQRRPNEQLALQAKRAIEEIDRIVKEQDGWKEDGGIKYVVLENGARMIYVPHDEEVFAKQAQWFDANNDDRLLFCAAQMLRNDREQDDTQERRPELFFVSQDRMARMKAGLLGVTAQEFQYEEVRNVRRLYDGQLHREFATQEAAQAYIGEKLGEYQRQVREREQQKRRLEDLVLRPHQVVMIGAGGAAEYHMIEPDKSGGLVIKNLEHYEGFVAALKKNQEGEEQAQPREKVWGRLDAQRECLREWVDASNELTKTAAKKLRRDIVRAKSMRELDALEEQLKGMIGEMIAPKGEGGHHPLGEVLRYPLNPVMVPEFEQKAYLELLLNPTIPIVSVIGPQGTGKTIWAVMAGLHQLRQGIYPKMTYLRPLVGIDEGLGFYKGDYRQKVDRWIQPCEEALKMAFGYWEMNDPEARKEIEQDIETMERHGYLEYEIPTHAAGRNFRGYVIVDEAHLLTRDQARLLIGRIAENTKMILVGDPGQIGATSTQTYSWLNERSSGLAHVVERLNGNVLYGHITLPERVVKRSLAAKLANEL